MANQEHLDILKQGIKIWNKWRKEYPDIKPDLSEAMLQRAYLHQANLCGTNLSKTDLSMALLIEANLKQANLEETELFQANLAAADLSGTDLRKARPFKADFGQAILCGTDFRGVTLYGVNFRWANLNRANLSGADLTSAILVDTNLENADITGCSIYGASAWNINLKNAVQSNLIITRPDEPIITVDNLKVAQFIYLLLDNQEIRDVIDTITSKVVLILGRFTDERKLVLDALRDELRNYNYSPIVFDFVPSAKRDLTETISTLAHMSCFVIADITDAKSISQELQAIVPYLPSVFVQPILQGDAPEYAMFEHYERYPWVLPIYRYQDIPSLLASIKEHIIKSVEEKANESEKTKQLKEEVRKLKEKVRKLEGKNEKAS